jgi:hypothetical protein
MSGAPALIPTMSATQHQILHNTWWAPPPTPYHQPRGLPLSKVNTQLFNANELPSPPPAQPVLGGTRYPGERKEFYIRMFHFKMRLRCTKLTKSANQDNPLVRTLVQWCHKPLTGFQKLFIDMYLHSKKPCHRAGFQLFNKFKWENKK